MSTQQLGNDVLTAEQVKAYLQTHPEFFEQHAKLLAEITLPSPHGSGVISLAERQQLAQRLQPLGDPLDFGALEVHLSNLRRKIGAERIHTVRGVGYRLEVRESPKA